MFSASFCQFENSHRTIPSGNAHLAFQPPSLQHSLQSWVESPFLNLQQFIGNTFYVLSESIAMHWSRAQRLQNHQFQSAWKEVAGLRLPHHFRIVHPKYYIEHSKRQKSVVGVQGYPTLGLESGSPKLNWRRTRYHHP